jgi:hypothetical protein
MFKSKSSGNEGCFTKGVLCGGFIFYLILGRFFMFPLPALLPLPLSCSPCHHAPTALVLALVETAAQNQCVHTRMEGIKDDSISV